MATRFLKVDVRKLLAEGVEPYPQICRIIESLKPGEGISVTAPFLPSPLIEKLKGEGFTCRPERQADGSWITRFSME